MMALAVPGRRLAPCLLLFIVAACDLDRGPVTPPLDGDARSEDGARGERPAALYLRFVRAVAVADTMEALGPFLEDQVRAHVARLPSRTRGERLASAKREEPEQVTVTREAIEGDLAMLQLSGVRAGRLVRGRATLVREDPGGWRVQSEAWEQ
jgi:hypothetical protein